MSNFLAALPHRHLLLLAALAAVLLAGSSAPRAEPEPTDRALIVGAHLLTGHIGRHAEDFRTVTPGLYVRGADGGVTLGAFRNSHGQASAYAAWTWQRGAFAITAGGVTGYPHRRVSPLLIPSVAVRVPGTTSALRLALVPKPPYHGASGGLHFAWETRL